MDGRNVIKVFTQSRPQSTSFSRLDRGGKSDFRNATYYKIIFKKNWNIKSLYFGFLNMPLFC